MGGCIPCNGVLTGGGRHCSNPSFVAYHKAGSKSVLGSKRRSSIRDSKRSTFDNAHVDAYTFTFNELATATNNFRDDCFLGGGGFGGVYKGWLEIIQQARSLFKDRLDIVSRLYWSTRSKSLDLF